MSGRGRGRGGGRGANTENPGPAKQNQAAASKPGAEGKTNPPTGRGKKLDQQQENHRGEKQSAPPKGRKEKAVEKDDTQANKPCSNKSKPKEKAAETLADNPDTPGAKIGPTKCKKGRVMPPKAELKQTDVQDESQVEQTGRPERERREPTASALNSKDILKKTLEKLKIKTAAKSRVVGKVNDIKVVIRKHMKEKTGCFRGVMEPLNTGSYYEKLKISKPDEFDVMFPFLVERVNIEPFGDNGASYKVGFKRGNNPLKKLEQDTYLPASKVLKEFRNEVKKAVKEFKGWTVTKKKPGCPAVTLTTEVDSTLVSLDVVLSLHVTSHWPDFTDNGLKIENWLGTKKRKEYRMKHFYLVPKHDGRGTGEENGFLTKDTWRISFTHIEKDIIQNHGNKKTCCEDEGEKCCRKNCLKLLKHLLHLLKEEDSTLEKISSYHGKTALLHAFSLRHSDDEWKPSELLQCFTELLQDFSGHLRSGNLPNFFIPTQNLLAHVSKKTCKTLEEKIRKQLEGGFPIFAKHLEGLHLKREV